jgi:hypothetical protein
LGLQGNREGWAVHPEGTSVRIALAAAIAAASLAACSGLDKKKEPVVVNPNVYPQDYRKQIGLLLATTSKDAADFHGTLISQPMLKNVGDTPHYIVCVEFNGHGVRWTKVAIYLEGAVTQFIDATPEQCGDAQYQPFGELEGKPS